MTLSPAIVGPHEAVGAWTADPLALLGLLGLLAAYARGLERLRRGGGGPAAWRVRAFAAAWVLLVVALSSPLDALAHTLLTAHMAQHLVLMGLLPPLLLAGRTVFVASFALPARWRRPLHGTLRRWRRVGDRGGVAAGVWGAYLVVLWGWHVPAAYEAALRSDGVHVLEHATMLAGGCLLWWAVLRRGVVRYGSGVLALALTGAGTGALAAVLTFSTRPWYASYDPVASGWPLTALTDQRLAGAVLWVVGGLLHAAAGAVLFARWLRALDRRARHRRVGWRAAAGTLAAAALIGGCVPDSPATVSVRGREALVDYGCVACHAVEGLPSPQGRVGPSLHDLAGRRTLAGELPNTPANLRRWIQDPQGIDPGNVMPDLGVDDADADAIVRYLDGLAQ